MKLACLVLFAVACAVAKPTTETYNLDDAPQLFEKFMKDYQRNYNDDSDKQDHYDAFVDSLKAMNEMNAKAGYPLFKISVLADRTYDELVNIKNFFQGGK